MAGIKCNRCERLGRSSRHPDTAFYKDARGRPLPTCKRCRRELSRFYYRKYQREAEKVKELADEALPESGRIALPELAAARTIVTIEEPAGPKVALWRCMSCYAKAVTRATGSKPPAFPENWKHMGITVEKGRTIGTILCGSCAGMLNKAKRIMDRVIERMKAQEVKE